MCLGLPCEIVEILDPDHGLARVQDDGRQRDVSLALLREESLGVGDWVLVHLGFAMAKIDAAQAAETRRFLNELGLEGVTAAGPQQ